jgi:hypothetical protein
MNRSFVVITRPLSQRWWRRRAKIDQPMETAYRLIPLTQGQVATVDAADYESLTKWCWFAVRTRSGYIPVRSDHWRSVRMASAILFLRKGERVTFKNGNTLDLRRENLLTASLKNREFLLWLRDGG